MADCEPSPKKPCQDAEQLFQNFKQQLDDKQDRRERIVKLSRDTTTESKRIIFHLHRVSGAGGVEEKRKILDEASERLGKLRASKLATISKELSGRDQWEYRRAFCLGLQEFVEAQSFLQFLQDGSLLSHSQLRSELAPLLVSPFDYLLGVCDLSGEMMRLALNCGPKGDADTPRAVLAFLQDLLSCSESVTVRGPEFFAKDFEFKLNTMRQSVQKVEKMCYDQQMRRAELLHLSD